MVLREETFIQQKHIPADYKPRSLNEVATDRREVCSLLSFSKLWGSWYLFINTVRGVFLIVNETFHSLFQVVNEIFQHFLDPTESPIVNRVLLINPLINPCIQHFWGPLRYHFSYLLNSPCKKKNKTFRACWYLAGIPIPPKKFKVLPFSG